MWWLLWSVVTIVFLYLVKRLVLKVMVWSNRRAQRSETAKVLSRLKQKRISEFPPPYPNGWYHAARCDELAQGEVKEVPFMGSIIILYRGEDGQAHAADPYCPHLGASFASGGRVEKNCLVCPFHLYKFDITEKKCVEIPNLPEGKSIPAQLKLKTYPTREVDCMILVWWHGEGAEPTYYPEPTKETASGEFYEVDWFEEDVDMHIMDYVENSVDFAHFLTLHNRFCVPYTNIPIPGCYLQHDPGWSVDPERPHVAYLTNKAVLMVGGVPRYLPNRTGERISAVATFLGPGSIILFTFDVPGFGRLHLYECHTPLEPMKLRTKFHWFASGRLPFYVIRMIVGGWVSQWRADVQIWSSKIHLKTPGLTATDGPVRKMRKWMDQFYCEDRSKNCSMNNTRDHTPWDEQF